MDAVIGHIDKPIGVSLIMSVGPNHGSRFSLGA